MYCRSGSRPQTGIHMDIYVCIEREYGPSGFADVLLLCEVALVVIGWAAD